MMRIVTASEPGDSAKENEDWLHVTPELMVMLDGATARTDTGCKHGIAWYVAKLGSAITNWAASDGLALDHVLRLAIHDTRLQHDECDLSHPATPSAAVAIARREADTLRYLVLGDVTLLIEGDSGIQVVTDDRVDATARAERLEAARLPFGTAEKQQALLRMKHAELAARNKEGGYWIAAAHPKAADHAFTGAVPLADLSSVTMLTDGAARAVVLLGLLDWSGLLDLIRENGPDQLIQLVRDAEATDPTGSKWPRNKGSDDASVAVVCGS